MKLKTSKRLSFEERGARILDAALGLFSKKGFEGTTTKAIAAKAGVNESLLFRHFPTKEKMYTALLKQKLSQYEAEIFPALEKTLELPLDAALFQIATIIIQKNRENPAFFRMMLFSSLENHRLSRLFFKQRLPLLVFLEKFFQKNIRQRGINLPHPGVIARAFFSMIHHYILITQLFQAPEYYPVPETELLKNYVAIFIGGIGA